MTLAQIDTEITKLLAAEYRIGTNAGTFGGAEGLRAIGTGEEKRGTYARFARLNQAGSVCRRLCDGEIVEPDRMPGREMRGTSEFDAAKARLAELSAARQRIVGR